MTKLFDFFPESLKAQVVDSAVKNNKRRKENVEYAFSRLKKLPLENKRNILSAITHFFNVKGTSLEEKQEAYKKILDKAQDYQICTMGFIEQCKNLFNNK